MQLLPLLLVAVVMAADSGLRPLGMDWGVGRLTAAAVAVAPVMLIVAASALGVSHFGRQLSRGKVHKPLIGAERAVRWARWLILVNHGVAVLVFGWLDAVRSVAGDLIFIDEFLAIVPALAGVAGTYWAYFPIERRMREALLVRRLDEGMPIYPTPSRWQYVLLQMRLNVLLLLVPVLLIVFLAELIEFAANEYVQPETAMTIRSAGGVAAAALIFLFSPMLAVGLLDVQPLAPGPLRDSLVEVCRTHSVRIRQLLVWNTHGTMINAAVMGLIGRLRYVMITDALLEMLPAAQVRAVMAHEIGHVRKHHLPWLVVCLLASFVAAANLFEWPARFAQSAGWLDSSIALDIARVVTNGGMLVVGLMIFGWMCRRFERQADTFAVQHLSANPAHEERADAASLDVPPASRQVITTNAIQAMCGALESIAHLNSVDRDRPSWRHGSIAWRQEYLESLNGKAMNRLPIDRLVPWLKVASAVVFGLGIVQEAMR